MLKLTSGIIVFILSINLSAQKIPSVKDLEKTGLESLMRGMSIPR